MLTVQWEDIERSWTEARDLVTAHWREAATEQASIPLAVDWGRMIQLQKLGMYCVLGVRDEGRLVGYAGIVICPHLHFKETLHATCASLYVEKDKRGAGIRLVREMEKRLAGQGVQRLLVNVPKHGSVGLLFRHLGYELAEETYAKMLSGA